MASNRKSRDRILYAWNSLANCYILNPAAKAAATLSNSEYTERNERLRSKTPSVPSTCCDGLYIFGPPRLTFPHFRQRKQTNMHMDSPTTSPTAMPFFEPVENFSLIEKILQSIKYCYKVRLYGPILLVVVVLRVVLLLSEDRELICDDLGLIGSSLDYPAIFVRVSVKSAKHRGVSTPLRYFRSGPP